MEKNIPVLFEICRKLFLDLAPLNQRRLNVKEVNGYTIVITTEKGVKYKDWVLSPFYFYILKDRWFIAWISPFDGGTVNIDEDKLIEDLKPEGF